MHRLYPHVPKDMRAPLCSPPVTICMRASGAVYRLSVSLPNFPLEKYQKAVAGIGDTEGERAQKFRIGQNIFRDALMEYWNGSCPLSGISFPELLRASHMMPWSRCETDGQRLDVYNGLFCLRYGMPRSMLAW